MSTDSVTTPAAGWYPDPVAPEGMRWWSGSAWTEHTSAPAPQAADDVPDLSRFARDPSVRPATALDEPLPIQKDPYRDRNVLAGLALVVAILSVPGTILSLFVELPDIVSYVITGVPMALALLGLVASFKLGYRTRMAWLAIAISAVTMIAGFAVSAQQASQDLHLPTVTDVPGVSDIQNLENENEGVLGG